MNRAAKNDQSSIMSKIFVSLCYLQPKIKRSQYVEIVIRLSSENNFTIYSDILELTTSYDIEIKRGLEY